MVHLVVVVVASLSASVPGTRRRESCDPYVAPSRSPCAGADVFVDMITCLLSKYIRSAAERTCADTDFAAIDGLPNIMRRVADAVR